MNISITKMLLVLVSLASVNVGAHVETHLYQQLFCYTLLTLLRSTHSPNLLSIDMSLLSRIADTLLRAVERVLYETGTIAAGCLTLSKHAWWAAKLQLVKYLTRMVVQAPAVRRTLREFGRRVFDLSAVGAVGLGRISLVALVYGTAFAKHSATLAAHVCHTAVESALPYLYHGRVWWDSLYNHSHRVRYASDLLARGVAAAAELRMSGGRRLLEWTVTGTSHLDRQLQTALTHGVVIASHLWAYATHAWSLSSVWVSPYLLHIWAWYVRLYIFDQVVTVMVLLLMWVATPLASACCGVC